MSENYNIHHINVSLTLEQPIRPILAAARSNLFTLPCGESYSEERFDDSKKVAILLTMVKSQQNLASRRKKWRRAYVVITVFHVNGAFFCYFLVIAGSDDTQNCAARLEFARVETIEENSEVLSNIW